MSAIALRPVTDADLPLIFDQMRDPAAVRMAAFTSDDPSDRAAFDARMARLRRTPDVTMRVVTDDGVPVGTAGAFVVEGDTEVTFWIDRGALGPGRGEPRAGAAAGRGDHPAGVRPRGVRQRGVAAGAGEGGFRGGGTERSYAPARGAEIEETVLRLAG